MGNLNSTIELRNKIKQIKPASPCGCDSSLSGESYDDTALKARISTLENKPDNDTIYDDTQIKNDIANLQNQVNSISVYNDSTIVAEIKTLKEQKTDIDYVTDAIATARQKSVTEFLLQDFTTTFETPLEIPSVLTDIPNTQIKNVDITLDDETAVEYAIAGLVKYEVLDENNQRLNAFQVCSFSMNGQVTLRLRMMCAGQNSVFAKQVKGAILLKRR